MLQEVIEKSINYNNYLFINIYSFINYNIHVINFYIGDVTIIIIIHRLYSTLQLKFIRSGNVNNENIFKKYNNFDILRAMQKNILELKKLLKLCLKDLIRLIITYVQNTAL